MFALSKQMGQAVRVDLLRGITSFRNKVDPSELLAAYRSGDWRTVVRAVPWGKLPGAVDPAINRLADAARRGAKVTFAALPAPVRQDLRYDIHNPRIERYINETTGRLITTVREGTVAAVRHAVKRAVTHALPPSQVAAEIRGSIGLNARQATALANYRNRLTEGGVSPKRVHEMARAYEERLLDQRALMIGRTEVRFATNEGQQDVWLAAAKDDLLPKGSRRVWIVDGDPCENLCLPMHNVATGLEEPWVLPDNREVNNPTESHPHCYCIASLDMGD